MEEINPMEGILRCSRYSFGPNRLHYCGPDANKELKDLIENKETNANLAVLLKQFKTLYPYLNHISKINNIRDPFNSSVVEAYWLGNRLLEKTEVREFHRFITENLSTKNKTSTKIFEKIEEKISLGAVPHHSFHVLNVWSQAGHGDRLDVLERMGECLITSGKVLNTFGPEITVLTETLIYEDGKLKLGSSRERKITRQLQAEYDIEQIKPGQIVSIHWGVPCEVITKKQAEMLKKYTLKNIAFANRTI